MQRIYAYDNILYSERELLIHPPHGRGFVHYKCLYCFILDAYCLDVYHVTVKLPSSLNYYVFKS